MRRRLPPERAVKRPMPNIENVSESPQHLWDGRSNSGPDGLGGLVLPGQVVAIPDDRRIQEQIKTAFEKGRMEGVAQLTDKPAQTLAQYKAAQEDKTKQRKRPNGAD
jgi:hypothetical protein